MHTRIRFALAAAALSFAPAVASAQHTMGGMAAHELGVDVAGFYRHQSLGGVSVNHVLLGTPVDVRLGFVTGERLVIEPRFGLAFDTKGTGTTSTWSFTPDVNALVNFGKGTYRQGPYVTFGVGLDLSHNVVAAGGAAQLAVNGGIGTRVPWESGALRLEAFVRNTFKDTTKGVPNALDIGARVGISLWH